MKAYSLIAIFIFMCCFCKYTSVKIMSELKKNILNFGYGINFNYKGMLAHSFDRFYLVTKFILPLVSNLEFSPIDFNEKCNYSNDDLICNQNSEEYISNLKVYCKKMYHSYMNEISYILSNFPKDREETRSIIASLITG